jgi:excisionase family DNA binding protein
MSTTTDENVPVQPVVLRYKEAAKVLGVSTRTLWVWTKAGIVPHVRVGLGRRKVILYPLDELKSWLSRQSQVQMESKKESSQ